MINDIPVPDLERRMSVIHQMHLTDTQRHQAEYIKLHEKELLVMWGVIMVVTLVVGINFIQHQKLVKELDKRDSRVLQSNSH